MDHRIDAQRDFVRLDGVLREVAGEPSGETPSDRPEDARAHEVTYAGERLSPGEADEVRQFIAWLRYRRRPAR